MATMALAATDNAHLVEQVVMKGDLTSLTPAERLQYYREVCSSVGINPLTKPFDYLVLNGKMVLYANRSCAEQLRKVNGVGITKLEKDWHDDIYIVTAYAKDGSGREDAGTGAVACGNLKGEALANALMKAETKAKRRVTLSICGLGMLDETEVETIPGARTVNVHEDTGEVMGPRPLPVPKNVDASTGEIIETAPPTWEEIIAPAPMTEREQRQYDQPRYASQKASAATMQAKAWFFSTARDKWGLEHEKMLTVLGVASIKDDLPDKTLGELLDMLDEKMKA
jgi:hypothetical protein